MVDKVIATEAALELIDVIEGHGGTFSLEGPQGKAFHTRSRVFTEVECRALGL